jgi:nitrogen fixation/metabolism regulation signal transduction histidine kinase
MLERSTRTIVEQVEAMKNMVNDFRDYARLPPPVAKPIDLNVLVSEVLDLYTDGPFAVKAELDPILPPVLADADQIRQVLHNLIKNAGEAVQDKDGPKVSASETAPVTVATRLNGRMAKLTVSDHGAGFPPEFLARAFEPYVTTKPKGTGLGLAIVQKIVTDHGGTIMLANRPAQQGGGAEVSIQIPLHRDSQPANAAA